MKLPTAMPIAAEAKHTHAASIDPENRAASRVRGGTRLENTSSSVLRSKSRSSEVATNAATMNVPMRLRSPSIRMTTKGAFRLTAPMAPPS